jgi:mannose-6-phosphate isomerase-like protein (cupin superfamily)
MTDIAAPTEINQPAPPGKFLVDSYENWAKSEGVPIHTGAAVDLLTAEVKPWARYGLNGACVHVSGRDDFLTVFLHELPPNSGSVQQQHLYEEIYYVLAGEGATEFEGADGRKDIIEWGPKSIFALPMNAKFRHRNMAASPARFVSLNDMRYLFNLYRSEQFVFGNTMRFAERYAGPDAVADASKQAPGPLTLANGTLSADIKEIAPGTYHEASRQMFGAHLLGVDGEGTMLTWEEGAQDYTRMEWRHGIVTAAPGYRFAQQFNMGAGTARYLDVQFGSQLYPNFRYRRAAYGDTTVYAAGSATIPFAEQDPRIHQMWLETLQTKGFQPQMRT